MRSTRGQLRTGFFTWLLSAAMLWLSASAWGQTAPSGETPAGKPAVTVERRGRLLVLNYKLVGTDGQPLAPSGSGGRPEFAIHQGNRKIASGQFEYG
jgi:hypothetical protein